MTNIIIACTGSVATIKLKEIIEQCLNLDKSLNIIVVCTERSKHFFQNEIAVKDGLFDLNSFNIKINWWCSDCPVFDDSIEWNSWNSRSDPVIHIELRKWADLMLIAPLDANTLAKIANGLCDNLLTSLVRAWDINKPIFIAPAMNTFMYEHPMTKKHLDVLEKELNFKVIPPKVKLLACGDYGIGAMEEPNKISQVIVEYLKSQSK